MTPRHRRKPTTPEDASPRDPSGAPGGLRRLASFGRGGLAVVVAAILFSAAIRVRLADAPLERDEGECAYAGRLVFQGVPPYRLA